MSRILIIKLSSIGDIFHALPTVHELRRQLGVQVDWVTQKAYGPLVACCDDVDRVFGFDRGRFLRSLHLAYLPRMT